MLRVKLNGTRKDSDICRAGNAQLAKLHELVQPLRFPFDKGGKNPLEHTSKAEMVRSGSQKMGTEAATINVVVGA